MEKMSGKNRGIKHKEKIILSGKITREAAKRGLTMYKKESIKVVEG